MLTRGEVDLVFADLSLTADRGRVIDFSQGLRTEVASLTFRSPRAHANFIAYFSALSNTAWMAAAGVAVIVSIGLYFTLTRRRDFGLHHALALVTLAVMQLDYPALSVGSVASRTLFWMTCMFGYVLMASYISVLTSFLAVAITSPQVSTFEELLGPKKFKLYVWDSSSYYGILRSSPPGDVFRKIFDVSTSIYRVEC